MVSQNQVKKQILTDVQNNTIYYGCTFYLEENLVYKISNSCFDNCSFRKSARFINLYDCQFQNCNFLNGFIVYLLSKAGFEKIPLHIFDFYQISELHVLRTILEDDRVCWKLVRVLHGKQHHLNEINFIPKEIGKLANLQIITLPYGKISSIPIEFAKLRNLRCIDLSSNKISYLPIEFKDLTNLTHIKLSRNRFTQFPFILLSLPNLQELDLSANQITKIPREIVKISSLENLYLWLNPIRKLEKIKLRYYCKDIIKYHGQLVL